MNTNPNDKPSSKNSNPQGLNGIGIIMKRVSDANKRISMQIDEIVRPAIETQNRFETQEDSLVGKIRYAQLLMLSERELDNMGVSRIAGVGSRMLRAKDYKKAQDAYRVYWYNFEDKVKDIEGFIKTLRSLGENELAEYLAKKYAFEKKEKDKSNFNPNVDRPDVEAERLSIKKIEFDRNLKIAEDFTKYVKELNGYEIRDRLLNQESVYYDTNSKAIEELRKNMEHAHDELLTRVKDINVFVKELRELGKNELADDILKYFFEDGDMVQQTHKPVQEVKSHTILGRLIDMVRPFRNRRQ